MKILHTVEFYYPSIGGSQEVVRHLSERMVKMGHDVTVATTKIPGRKSLTHNGVKIVEFELSGNKVHGIKGDPKAYHDFLKKGDFDVIMNYATQQWATDLFYDVMDEVKGKKVLVPVGYSALKNEAYTGYFKKLPTILKKYDATVYLADEYQDTGFGRENMLKNMVLIPNGADENEFTEIDPEEKEFIKARYGIGGLTIITVGNHTNEKGHIETIRAFKRLPVRNATLVIVGTIKPHDGCYDLCQLATNMSNNSLKATGKRIILFDGENRKDAVALLKASDIFAFFSNIECSPLVLFEAAAAGVPFLASSAGNNVEIAKWTGAGKIVKCYPRPDSRVQVDLKDSVLQLTKLAYNKKLREELGKTGRENWKKHYTWKKLTENYVDLYSDLVDGKALKDTL